MKPRKNNILTRDVQKTFKIEHLQPNEIVNRERECLENLSQRELFRKENAKEFLGEVNQNFHLYGFSKGQFSIIDIIEELVDQIGECDLTISTWTAASADLQRVNQLVESKKCKSIRMLVDFSFQRRQPGVLKKIREMYGADSVRLAKNHAKFILLKNERFKLVIRTSMNLNFNPRFEDIDIKDDARLFDFVDSICHKIFNHFKPNEQEKQGVKQHNLDFARFN